MSRARSLVLPGLLRAVSIGATPIGLASIGAISSACGPSSERAPTEPVEPPSTGNPPIEVTVLGRTVRVRCEEACVWVDRELDVLRDGCVNDPTAVPGVLAIDGASLRQWGCCHEAERAYGEACGLDDGCASEWLARCEHVALSAHAAGHGSGPPAGAAE